MISSGTMLAGDRSSAAISFSRSAMAVSASATLARMSFCCFLVSLAALPFLYFFCFLDIVILFALILPSQQLHLFREHPVGLPVELGRSAGIPPFVPPPVPDGAFDPRLF